MVRSLDLIRHKRATDFLFTEADGDLRCQAGARWEDINHVLKEKGIPLFFPVGPFPMLNQQGLTLHT